MVERGVLVDDERCMRLGQFLKGLGLPAAAEEEAPCTLSSRDLRMLYFIVVAVCHQTSPIGKPRLEGMINGELRFGWDYLVESWMLAAKADPAILTPGWLMFAQASDIVYLLFDNERKCGSNISDPAGRAELLRDIGFRMQKDGVRHVDEYYSRAGGWLKNKGGIIGLEHMLKKFEAYGKDPVNKKLTYFLILMNRSGFWKYLDIQNLGAPVDYHEMRLHLRLGTVKITDEELAAKVAAGTVLNSAEDVRIRSAIYEAIFKITDASEIMPPDLHQFFWNMSRNCCRRDETHCDKCFSHGALPERYLALLVDKRCIFSAHCASVSLPHAEKPKEPKADTDLY